MKAPGRDPLAHPLERERHLLDQKRKLRERRGPEAEYPLRAYEQNQDKDDKRKPVRCLGIDIGVGALRQNSKQEAAGHRKGRILGSSDHHRNKAEGVECAAQVRVGEGARGDQNAGYSGQKPGDGEGDGCDHHRIRADAFRHFWIGGCSHADFAE